MKPEERTRDATVLGITFLNVLVALGLGRFQFSMVVPFLQAYFHITFTQVGVLAGLILTGYLLFTYFGGVALHRFSARKIVVISLLLLTVAFLAVTYLGSYPLLCLSVFLMGAVSGTVYISAFPVIQARFREGTYGRNMGLVLSGVGWAMFLVSLAIRFRVKDPGDIRLLWRVSSAAAAFTLAVNVILLLGRLESRGENRAMRDRMSYSRAWLRLLQEPSLRNLTLCYLMYGVSYSAYLTYLFAYGVELRGVGATHAIWLVFATACTVSALVWGVLFDRYHVRTVVPANYCLTAAGLLTAVLSARFPALVVSSALFGLCFLGYVTMIGGFIVKATREQSPVYMGKLTLLHTAGQVLGAFWGGVIRDTSGSFRPVFAMALAALVLSWATFLPAVKAVEPGKERGRSPEGFHVAGPGRRGR